MIERPKYEIEYQCFGTEYVIEGEIATITGLTFEDIRAVTKDVTRWNGQQFVDAFRQLGFNTNNRFIKFDRATEYPCLMRCKLKGDDKYWHGFVYYNDVIYIQFYGDISFDRFFACNPDYRITSMLQVWI